MWQKLSKADIILWRIGSESQHARYLQETFFFHCWQFFCYCSTWCSVWWGACCFVGWNAGRREGKHYHPYCQLTTAARNSVDCITQSETHGQSSRCKLWTLQYSYVRQIASARGNHLGVCWKSVETFSFWQSYQFASTSSLWMTTLDLSGYILHVSFLSRTHVHCFPEKCHKTSSGPLSPSSSFFPCKKCSLCNGFVSNILA